MPCTDDVTPHHRYGSPNVFSQFQPHVSVGWSSDAAAVSIAVAALKTAKSTECNAEVGAFVVGQTFSAPHTVGIYDVARVESWPYM
jgi:hypothetical protein